MSTDVIFLRGRFTNVKIVNASRSKKPRNDGEGYLFSDRFRSVDNLIRGYERR